MKRRALIGWLAVSVVLRGCGKAPRLPTIPPGKTILAFGDSVTFGTGAAAGEDWPTLLAGLTGWQVENAGIPGDTAEASRARMQALLDAHRPAVVIIEVGGNDFLRRRSAKAVKEDVRYLVQAAKGSGAQVALVAVPELSLLGLVAGKPSDAPIYQELAEEEQVVIVSEVFSSILSRPELRADQIHPNAEGYRQMAAGIHRHLQKVGLAPPGGR